MTTTVYPEDLAAERKAAIARRAERDHLIHLRHRAQMVIAKRWSLTTDELTEAIREDYPFLEPPEVDELLQEVLFVQRTERPKLEPGSVRVRPVELEKPPKRWIDPDRAASSRKSSEEEPIPRQRMDRDRKPMKSKMNQPRTPAPPAAAAPAEAKPEVPAMTKTVVPYDAKSDQREKVIALRDRLRNADPDVTPDQIAESVLQELSIQLTPNQAQWLRYQGRPGRQVSPRATPDRKPTAPKPAAPPTDEPLKPPAESAADEGSGKSDELLGEKVETAETEVFDPSSGAARIVTAFEPDPLPPAARKGDTCSDASHPLQKGAFIQTLLETDESEYATLELVNGTWWVRTNLGFDDLETAARIISLMFEGLKRGKLAQATDG